MLKGSLLVYYKREQDVQFPPRGQIDLQVGTGRRARGPMGGSARGGGWGAASAGQGNWELVVVVGGSRLSLLTPGRVLKRCS